MSKNNASRSKRDIYPFDISRDDAVNKNLGDGQDTVNVSANRNVDEVRVTFTSSEVGNDDARDGNDLSNQDGGLAVRLQRERGDDVLAGQVSRFDDEGITFESNGQFTFDVRDLVSGTERGNKFDTVVLGTMGNNMIDESGENARYYINGGMGNDMITGGKTDDFLVGGAGTDILTGGRGDDSFIGGAGDDRINGGKGDDLMIVNVDTDGADGVNLASGDDTVNVSSSASQIRLTFTSAEVGNAAANDSGSLTNQDDGLAVRLQAEDLFGGLTGANSRYDDEGITFTSTTSTFDVRDLVSGTQRGDQFNIVKLGTSGNDTLGGNSSAGAYYINGGAGNDTLNGDTSEDFLVGGTGNDRINGGNGDDSFIGGAGADTFVFTDVTGNDEILDFVSGTDKIDLSDYDIDIESIRTTQSGDDTVITVIPNTEEISSFQITLRNAGEPTSADFIF